MNNKQEFKAIADYLTSLRLNPESQIIFISKTDNADFAQYFKNITYFQAQEDIILGNNLFDAVIVVGALEYLKWDRWAIQQIFPLIKPEGYLILSVPNNIALSRLLNPVKLLLIVLSEFKKFLGNLTCRIFGSASAARIKKCLSGTGFKQTGFRYYSPRPLKTLLKKLGFKIIYAGYFKEKIILNCQKSVKQIDKSCTFKNRSFESIKPKELDSKLFSNKNVLVIAPHPDDEIIGCGGTLVKLQNDNAKITILYLTNGSTIGVLSDYPEGTKGQIRFDEAKNVSQLLKVNNLIYWDYNQLDAGKSQEKINKLKNIITEIKPNLIFVPFIKDRHAEHVAANKLLIEALKLSNLEPESIKILSYEVWGLVPPKTYSIIDHEFELKERMLMEYRTGMKDTDYLAFCESLNFSHSREILNKNGFVETFFDQTSREFISQNG